MYPTFKRGTQYHCHDPGSDKLNPYIFTQQVDNKYKQKRPEVSQALVSPPKASKQTPSPCSETRATTFPGTERNAWR